MNESEEIFWEASDPEDINNLKKWVSDNVLLAVEQSVDETEALIDVKDGSLKIVICSFDKPDGTGCFTKTFDMLEMVEMELSIYMGDEDAIENLCHTFENLAVKVREMAKQTSS